jgi:metal-dependent amidase/aminoacylase/carboxypeptidase family protein
MTDSAAEALAGELITGDGMPEYLRDPALHDLVMEWARAEARSRRLAPELDAALASEDFGAVTKLTDAWCRAGTRAAHALRKLGLTPLGRAEGYPRAAA